MTLQFVNEIPQAVYNTKWTGILKELAANPGKWAVISTGYKQSSIGSMISSLRSRYGKNGYEFAYRGGVGYGRKTV